MTEEYFTPEELVDRWRGKVNKRTLANWRSSGSDGPRYTKIGGRVLYPVEKVFEYERVRTMNSVGRR